MLLYGRANYLWVMLAALGPALTMPSAAATAASAAALPPLAVFNRCYATITRLHLSAAHRLYGPVQQGQISPVDACMQILTAAQFDQTSVDAAEKAAVVRTFANFHRTWFPSSDYNSVLPGDIHFDSLYLARDPGEAAHYLTRAMFTPGVAYASIVTETSGMVAQRTPGTPDASVAYPGTGGNANFGYTNSAGAAAALQPPLTYPGDITSVARSASLPAYSGLVLADPGNWPKPIPFYKHFGGGLLGAQSFLMLNFGRNEEPNDGGLKVPRRWSKAIINSLLCRDIPVIRTSDAAPFVDAQSPLPFRGQASCMACHQTMDTMAGTVRSLRLLSSQAAGLQPTEHIVSYDQSANGSSYYTQAPTGQLFFRNFDGQLINQSVTGLDQLGQALAAQDDFYVCAASHYFELFTGLRVSLADLGDPSTTPLSAAEEYYRSLVIQMGRAFRQSQSLPKLLRDIMSTDFYASPSLRHGATVE